MIGAFFLAAVLLIQADPAAAPASSQPPTAASPQTTTVSPAVVTAKKPASTLDPNEVICHSEPVLGTLFPKKVCATRQELSDRRRSDQQDTRQTTNLRPYDIGSGLGH